MQQTKKPYTLERARGISGDYKFYEKENATILGTAESLGLYKRNLDWTWHVNRTKAADALFYHLLYVAGISEDELQAMPVVDAIGLLNKSTGPQLKGVTLHDAHADKPNRPTKQKSETQDDRMTQAVKDDARRRAWDSNQWADFLDCRPDRVRKLKMWRSLQQYNKAKHA